MHAHSGRVTPLSWASKLTSSFSVQERHDKVILQHDNVRPHVAKPIKTIFRPKWLLRIIFRLSSSAQGSKVLYLSHINHWSVTKELNFFLFITYTPTASSVHISFEMGKELPLRWMVMVDIDTYWINFCLQKCRSQTSTSHGSNRMVLLTIQPSKQYIYEKKIW